MEMKNDDVWMSPMQCGALYHVEGSDFDHFASLVAAAISSCWRRAIDF